MMDQLKFALCAFAIALVIAVVSYEADRRARQFSAETNNQVFRGLLDKTTPTEEEAFSDPSSRASRILRESQFNLLAHTDDPFFDLHIPKTGGVSRRNLFFDDLESLGVPNGKSVFCDRGHKQEESQTVNDWNKWTQIKTCHVFQFEGFPFPESMVNRPRTWSMVRSPKSHVLSQFFHCTESSDHIKNRQYMEPDLTKWLEAWVDAMSDEKKAKENEKYKCYNPTNMQSFHLGLSGEESKEDLLEKYELLGLLDEFQISSCMMMAKMTGGRLPDRCICESEGGNGRHLASKDHGVEHHGSSYQTTPYQDELIGKLIQEDLKLYLTVSESFGEQVERVEEEFEIEICGSHRVKNRSNP